MSNFFESAADEEVVVPRAVELGDAFTRYGPNLYKAEIVPDFNWMLKAAADDLGGKAWKTFNPFARNFDRPIGVKLEEKFWWVNKILAEEFQRRFEDWCETTVTARYVPKVIPDICYKFNPFFVS